MTDLFFDEFYFSVHDTLIIFYSTQKKRFFFHKVQHLFDECKKKLYKILKKMIEAVMYHGNVRISSDFSSIFIKSENLELKSEKNKSI